jgi:hypothetical protein
MSHDNRCHDIRCHDIRCDVQAVEAWLEDLEQAAAEFESRLVAGQVAVLRQVRTAPDADPAALPPALLLRASRTGERLARLIGRAQEHRDELGRRLSQLPRPRRRPVAGYSYEIGQALDVAG